MRLDIHIERDKRRSRVLTPSNLPCLREVATVNVTRGCVHGCVYCYTQGYSSYPGRGHVVVYEDLAGQVAGELARKRRKPHRVYFSPSCDAFQPVPEVLDATFDVMHVLLDGGVQVAFLTKGRIDERFMALFASKPDMVFAQIGVTTLDAGIAAELEPNAATPKARLDNVKQLASLAIPVAVRLDPLLPFVTDTDENLAPLLEAARSRGARSVALNALFLRRQLQGNVLALYRRNGWPADELQRLFTEGVDLPISGERGTIRALPADLRSANYERIRTLAGRAGLETHVCGCKNVDITTERCHIAGPAEGETSLDEGDSGTPGGQRRFWGML